MAGRIDTKSRWTYNALDCAATFGALEALEESRNPAVDMVYAAQMALEFCTLAIQSRGIKIDEEARKDTLKQLRREFGDKCEELTREAGHTINPNSPQQVKKLFYEELGLREMKNKDGKVSCDREVLERIAKSRATLDRDLPRGAKGPHLTHCAHLADLILEARGVNKDMGMVKSPPEAGRMRFSLNVGATESFRFSASKNNFQKGCNIQQVKHSLRGMFVPDVGMPDMVYGDQDRAESNVVAHVSGDLNYIKAHAETDTHVAVARMVWPEGDWNGEEEHDIRYARLPGFIRHYSRRDMSKRVQHACNYMAGPWTIARLLGIKVKEAEDIQERYFGSFPGIQDWQQSIISDVKRYQRLYYPGGFYRDFFGRPWDEATHREAISSLPQAIVAWTTHIVMYRLWKHVEEAGEFEMLSHNHDAVLLQCKHWPNWRPFVEPHLDISWPGKHGSFVIPWTWTVGKNWLEASD